MSNYTPKTLEVIQKVKTTVTEIQDGLYFLEDFQKREGAFYEIKISSRVSIFVENELAQQKLNPTRLQRFYKRTA